MWNYVPFLLTLVPAGVLIIVAPRLIGQALFVRFLALTVGVWLAASLTFTALLIPLESHALTAEYFLRLFLMMSVVVLIPVAIAAFAEFVLMRKGVNVPVCMVVSGLASCASVLVLPPIALFAACAFVDPSCI